MKRGQRHAWRASVVVALALVGPAASAGGGYFLEGYGPFSQQMAGTSTAVGFDTFAGASNPAKLVEVGSRLDAGMQLFMPYRHIDRKGATQPIYDIAATSRHGIFYLPDGGFSWRGNDRLALGVTIYGNGGLDTDYRNTNTTPGSNFNPTVCGTQPSNYLFGCGRLGVDLSQIIIAPTAAWRVTPHQSIGIAPLIAYQRIDIYGFQAFEAFSERPDAVTNNGYDPAFGAGVRVGWFGKLLPWLDAGAAYSTRIYMQRFKRYQGIIPDEGRFDVPPNYSIGVAIRPFQGLTVALDVQRVEWRDIPALGNSNLNSFRDPTGEPLGSHEGSGFNWRNQTAYRMGVAYQFSERLIGRLGGAYSRRPQDESVGSTTLSMVTPNPIYQIAAGFTAQVNRSNDLQVSYERYLPSTYRGPSGTSVLGVGGTESMHPSVTVIYLAWTWRI